MFRELSLKAVYDSSEDDLVKDMFIPLLSHSRTYERGVGFFTSGWLRDAAPGILRLAENGGHATLVTSPILEPGDWNALMEGSLAQGNSYLRRILLNHVDSLATALEKNTRVALAWMVADGMLEIKLAVPRNKIGDFHDKFAVFTDAHGDRVAIHGSYNDSIKGGYNGEAFSVFRSWDSGQLPYVSRHQERFDALRKNENPFFRVYDLPEAAKERIVKLRGDSKRPYSMRSRSFLVSHPSIPEGLNLHCFQEKAVQEWTRQDFHGLFTMPTGTGKTITALAAATKLLEERQGLCVLVTVPYIHLIDQWAEDLTRFGFIPFQCNGPPSNWALDLKRRVDDVKLKARTNLCVIATHATAASQPFINLFEKAGAQTLLIADEVHYLGAAHFRNALSSRYAYRIGLSATPERWYDPEGSRILRDYFRREVIDFTLREAIDQGFLTPYKYYPHFVELTTDERDEVARLTLAVARLRSQDDPDEERIQRLLLRRSRVLAKASGKLDMLAALLEKQIAEEGQEKIEHTLIYSGESQHREVVQLVANLGLRTHEFVHTVSREERQRVLRAFAAGDIQVLVAVRCLDEGVNVPSTRTAYFLASTTNPRQFIQRRGRVLRKAHGKEFAIIHDFFAIAEDKETSQVTLRRELPRFAEFCSDANNGPQVQFQVQSRLIDYGLVHLSAKKATEIFDDLREDELIE